MEKAKKLCQRDFKAKRKDLRYHYEGLDTFDTRSSEESRQAFLKEYHADIELNFGDTDAGFRVERDLRFIMRNEYLENEQKAKRDEEKID